MVLVSTQHDANDSHPPLHTFIAHPSSSQVTQPLGSNPDEGLCESSKSVGIVKKDRGLRLLLLGVMGVLIYDTALGLWWHTWVLQIAVVSFAAGCVGVFLLTLILGKGVWS